MSTLKWLCPLAEVPLVLPELAALLRGCLGAVYWKDSFPLLAAWSSPKREANFALKSQKNSKLIHYYTSPLVQDHMSLWTMLSSQIKADLILTLNEFLIKL